MKMARKQFFEEKVKIPSGVTVSTSGCAISVKGPKGEVSKEARNSGLSITVKDDNVILRTTKAGKKDKKIIFTYKALMKGWLQGVVKGYVYKLKICSSHFPMSVTVKGNTLELKNFIGGIKPRHLEIKKGVSAKVDADMISLEGVDKELLGNMAGRIEHLTRRAAFDKRVFQDGIFLISKGKEDNE